MLARATETVSIFTGTTTNAWGDEVDDNSTPAATGVLASVLEQSRSVQGKADALPRTIRFVTGRIPAGTAVHADDRIRSDRTGRTYRVQSARSVANTATTSDIVLDLVEVDAS